MAETAVKTPLPADLPEDWNSGQIVAPDGESVGLTEQHGYNYLMRMVNRTQTAVNEVNEELETVGGKRTCRFTIGTSTNGWTEADCDYLCDGTDDQVEINQAISALPSSGGEVVLLSGTYHLSGAVLMTAWNTVLKGNGPSTVLLRESAEGSGTVKCMIAMGLFCELRDIAYNGGNAATEGSYEVAMSGGGSIRNVLFTRCGWSCIYISHTGGSGRMAEISGCTCDAAEEFIRVKSGSLLSVHDNLYGAADGTFLKTDAGANVQVRAVHNVGFVLGLYFVLDGLSSVGKSAIVGNVIASLQILNTENARKANAGDIVYGNIFSTPSGASTTPYVILLGEHTSGIFVTGNMLLENGSHQNHSIQDLGTNNIVRFNSDDPGGSTPATVQQATPAITVGADGKVTAAATQQAGYVAAGTKSAAVTLSSAQDADFVPENIKDGVTIFGTTGTLQAQSGGGTAGVESFNGRTGAVMPQAGDYTTADVGAVPIDRTINGKALSGNINLTAADVEAIPAQAVTSILEITQSDYDALSPKSPTTLYLIKE